MRRLVTLGVMLTLGVAATLPVAAQPKEYVIGGALELSGPFAIWGLPQRNAMQMLVDDINAAGGIKGAKLRFIAYDNQSKETEAVVVAKKLVEQDNVVALIGGGTTPTTMPLIPYVTEQKVPLCSIGSSNRIIEPPAERRWVFKTPSNTSDTVKKLLEHVKATGIKKVAFLSVNNAYGDTGRVEFEKAAGPAGLEVVAWEKFGATDKDMKPQLTKIKGLAPQALVVWSIPPAASVVAKNYRELGLQMVFYHDQGATILPKFIELAGGAAEGAYGVAVKLEVLDELPANDPQRPVITKFKKEYERRYKETAPGIAAVAYDCLLLVTKGLETGASDRAKLRDAMEAVKGLPGVIGIYNLSAEDHNGLGTKDLLIGQVKRNRWTIAR
jgi:branched-chain amino acid transport system substrate-binding protein